MYYIDDCKCRISNRKWVKDHSFIPIIQGTMVIFKQDLVYLGTNGLKTSSISRSFTRQSFPWKVQICKCSGGIMMLTYKLAIKELSISLNIFVVGILNAPDWTLRTEILLIFVLACCGRREGVWFVLKFCEIACLHWCFFYLLYYYSHIITYYIIIIIIFIIIIYYMPMLPSQNMSGCFYANVRLG